MKYIYLCLVILTSVDVQAKSAFLSQEIIQSKTLNDQRVISIYLPKSYYHQQAYDYPVLYLLDGENNINYSRSVSDFLADNGVIPELIIVAIHAGTTRDLDYLSVDPQTRQPAKGAADFHKFIKTELMPLVHGKYRAAPLEFISGHSYGGMFSTYVMLNDPGLFDGYFAQSPYFNQATGKKFYRDFKSFLQQGLSKPVFYHFSLGNEPELQKSHQKITQLLANEPLDKFTWHHDMDENKSHMTTRMVGQYEALEQYFVQDWPINNAQILKGKVKGLNQHVQKLSDQYSNPVLINETVFSTAIQLFLSQGNIALSIEASELYKQYYQDAVMAYYLAANAYGAKGKRSRALAEVITGIEKYQKNPEPSMKPYFDQLQQMQAMLNK